MVKTTLHEARAAAGLSIRTVAEAAGVSESSYGNYEHGFYYPRPDARERLCALFGAAEADLWPEGSRRYPRSALPAPAPARRAATASRYISFFMIAIILRSFHCREWGIRICPPSGSSAWC